MDRGREVCPARLLVGDEQVVRAIELHQDGRIVVLNCAGGVGLANVIGVGPRYVGQGTQCDVEYLVCFDEGIAHNADCECLLLIGRAAEVQHGVGSEVIIISNSS